MSERPNRLSPEYAAWADEKIVSLSRRVAELEARLNVNAEGGMSERKCHILKDPEGCGCKCMDSLRARVADYKVAFERTAKSLALSDKTMRECQLLLCPQEQWGDCAKDIKDGEKCVCGFEDGPFANAVPKNREADRLRALVAELESAWTKENNAAGKFEGQLHEAEARVAELEKEQLEGPLKIHNLILDKHKLSDDNALLKSRVAELIVLLIEVVHCGGQCSAELLAKIERSTQEEAGWTHLSKGPAGAQ